ncbi:hypothetical protein ACWDR9_39185, partial [Streptosporangium sandarakinum]
PAAGGQESSYTVAVTAPSGGPAGSSRRLVWTQTRFVPGTGSTPVMYAPGPPCRKVSLVHLPSRRLST